MTMITHRLHSLILAPVFLATAVTALLMPMNAATAAEPVQYLLRQILMEPDISPARRAEIRAHADSCLALALSGADFGELARRYSEEPGADLTGGDLGYFAYGNMVEPFSNAVFSMNPGDIAGPVETQFGFHIIELLGIDGDTRRARHILFMLEPGREDSLAVLDTLAGIRRELLAGADFDSLLVRYSRVPMINDTRGYMVWQQPGDMLPSFAKAVEGLGPGDISEPFLSILGFHIVQVDSVNFDAANLRSGFPAGLGIE